MQHTGYLGEARGAHSIPQSDERHVVHGLLISRRQALLSDINRHHDKWIMILKNKRVE